jgi:formamidopyrimidine-DNA glycosylase
VPELPDIVVYLEALQPRVQGQILQRVRVTAPFLLRTANPPLSTAQGKAVERLERLGKRIAIGLTGDLWLVLHLMIAGRLHWRKAGAALAGRNALAAFDFAAGALVLTEAGRERRASLHVVQGENALHAMDRGGIDPLSSAFETFHMRLRMENHTLKRALTDPRLFSGIGNAYSDEILHRARLSPLALTHKLSNEEAARLHQATRATLTDWIGRLRDESAGKFPEKVTAFRDSMTVHGRYRQPCPVCGTKVQRIRYASNETNYCPRCQTGGCLLADRSLSRLLGSDRPLRVEELK